jgi:TonB family protein
MTTNDTTTPSQTRSAGKTFNQRVIVLTLQAKAGDEPRVFRLNKERVVIGSVVSSDVRLVGEGMAPIHAVLELGAQGAVLYDLASETGVFVNGKKAVTQALKAGDIIKIGLFTLAFSIEDTTKLSVKDLFAISEGRALFLNPGEDLKPLLLEDERTIRDIFDYRPAQRPALEVIMSWVDTILDVEHFTREKQVTVGPGRRDDFAIPPLLSMRHFPIVSRSGENFTLNLDDNMSGVMQRKGQLQSFEEVRKGAIKGPSGYQIPIEKDDFAKVSLGEIDFYLSYTAAPPRIKHVFERDPFFLKILFSSLLMTALTVGGLWSIHVPTTLEAEQVPERIATIIYDPKQFEKPMPAERPVPIPNKPDIVPKVLPKITPTPKATAKVTPKPTPLATKPPTPAQAKGREGEGAKHSGKEGTRGKPNAPKTNDHTDKAHLPSPNAGKGPGGGHSQLPDLGNVDMLKGVTKTLTDVLGSSTAKLGKTGGRLQGTGVFTSEGSGGLALSGTKRGGGGDAESLGVGNKGRSFGRVGTGPGAAGDAKGDIIGGKTRVVIQTGGPEESVVMGAIDADAVEAAILKRKDEIRHCYERELNSNTGQISGRVGLSFVIGASGRVTQCGVESTSLKNPNIERCIVAVIKRIDDFPSPRGGGVVQVAFPFKFNSVGN